jgi:hypothetical protein
VAVDGLIEDTNIDEEEGDEVDEGVVVAIKGASPV